MVDEVDYAMVEGEFVHQTPNALLLQVCIGDEDTECWIPKSVISPLDRSDVEDYDIKGEIVELLVEEWFALQEGLI